MVVSGSHEFFRARELQKATRGAKSTGRRVVYIEAGDGAGLRDVLSGGVLFAEPALAILDSAAVKKKGGRKKKSAEPVEGDGSGWTDEDVELVVEHAKDTSAEVALVVHHAGDAGPTTFAAKVAAALPKGRVLNFEAPKPWERKAEAVKFLRSELKRLGKEIPEDLAEAVVRQVGPELGVLSFDAVKLSMLLDVTGRTTVERADVASLVTQMGTEDWQVLQDALGARNTKAVVRSLQEIRNGPAGDAVMKACVILERSTLSWLHGAALVESGASVEEAAARMSMHPFAYQKNVLPAAKRWGKEALADLLRRVVAVERGIKRGHVSPWVELESALILACRGTG